MKLLRWANLVVWAIAAAYLVGLAVRIINTL